MNYEYTGRHMDVTPALRSHVESHFERITHLFPDGDSTKAHVIIEVEKGGRHRAEVIVNWRDRVLTANTTVSDMYLALTQTIDKIEKQAQRLKTKVIDKHQRAKKVTTIEPPAADDGTSDDGASAETSAPRILPVNRYPVKPMTPEEAALRLADAEDQFIVFRDSDSSKISVLYRRQDGNYGLIQP